MGWMYAVLLAGAVAVLLAAEWPRVSARLGLEDRRLPGRRRRRSRRPDLRLVTPSESEEFAASVERDLDQLPTTLDERDRR